MKSPETKRRKPVISLLGVSGSGKSSVATEVSARLSRDYIRTAIIKKDDAIWERGRILKPTAKSSSMYGAGSRDEMGIRRLMNNWVVEALPDNDVIFLEGGTRTPSARQATLEGTAEIAALTIVRFDISPIFVAKRLRQRRHENDRADDSSLIMFGKLAGQLIKDFTHRGQDFDGVTYYEVNADRPIIEVADSVEIIVREQLQ